MGSSDSTAYVVQQRVALLLLPLRLWIGVTWLRAGLEKALQPDWFDGTALIHFVQRQAEAGTAPWLLYIDLLSRLVQRAATPLGLAVVGAQIVIGLCLLTGTLTNLALLSAIVIDVNLILAGIASPSQYAIVAQVVLLAGGAGAAYSMDRWLSRALRTSLLTGHRGLVGGVRVSRGALVMLAVATTGLAAAAVPTIRSVLPQDGADDPGLALAVLALLIALLAVALTSSKHRVSDDGSFADDVLGPGLPPGMPPYDDETGMPVPPQRPVPDSRVPVGSPPHGQPVVPRPRPVQPGTLSEPWESPGPLVGQPPVAQPAPQDQPTSVMQTQTGQFQQAVRDQPTTQFVRQRRSRVPQDSPSERQAPPPANDPYAELRELPP